MHKQSKVLKWALIIGIVIVLNMFFNYALSLVYQQPNYNCPVEIPAENTPLAYQNTQNTACQNNFQTAENSYDRNVFITLILLGVICVALANFFRVNMLLSVALSLAGVLSFIIASMRYWSSADDLIKVIILAIALAILIWVAVKKFKDN